MPAAIQMMAALALFMVAVVTLLVSIVIGAIFARVVYSATRWVIKVLNEPGANGIAVRPIHFRLLLRFQPTRPGASRPNALDL